MTKKSQKHIIFATILYVYLLTPFIIYMQNSMSNLIHVKLFRCQTKYFLDKNSYVFDNLLALNRSIFRFEIALLGNKM